LACLSLFTGLSLFAQRQALADLRSAGALPSGFVQSIASYSFSINKVRCVKSARQASLQDGTDIVDQISARLAATPLFVESYPSPSRGCSAGQTAPAMDSVQKLMPANFCTSARISTMSPRLSPFCLPQGGGVDFRTWDILRSPGFEPSGILQAKPGHEGFHWRPALIESVEFLLFEHAFRLADDPYLRYLLFHKPFWHGWLVSAGQFDMSRWGDGDDFLVNYIGHPMQGGVTGDIYIQNDPRSRGLKFGRSREYWQSRMRAMFWSAVYSAYFEIGPVLSEAAIGNEGGYTYTPGCGHRVCDRPGYKPSTNNTGWVDFIVTPTIGTGLLVLEDGIEREIVDRLAKDNPGFGYKALRATLNPTRSMANMLAGRYPWYRFTDDEIHPGTEFGFVANSGLETRIEPWRYERRWTTGVHYTNIDLPMDWPGCAACRVHSSGIGATLGYRLTNVLYFDSELNVFPGSSSSSAKGRAEELLAGVKVGKTFGSWGLFTTMRPGVIHYEKTLVPGSQSEYESANRFALDAGGVVEYYASSRSTIRFDIGTTFVRYLTGHPDPRQLPETVLSTDYIATQGNFHLGSGYVFRF
jgi:hypothetical protein